MQPPIRNFDLHLAPDMRRVTRTATVLNIREFELCQLAYRFWYERDLRENVLDGVFAEYLLHEQVPTWVRDYCQRVLNLAAVNQLDPRDFGADRPRENRTAMVKPLYASFVTLFAFFIYLLLF